MCMHFIKAHIIRYFPGLFVGLLLYQRSVALFTHKEYSQTIREFFVIFEIKKQLKKTNTVSLPKPIEGKVNRARLFFVQPGKQIVVRVTDRCTGQPQPTATGVQGSLTSRLQTQRGTLPNIYTLNAWRAIMNGKTYSPRLWCPHCMQSHNLISNLRRGISSGEGWRSGLFRQIISKFTKCLFNWTIGLFIIDWQEPRRWYIIYSNELQFTVRTWSVIRFVKHSILIDVKHDYASLNMISACIFCLSNADLEACCVIIMKYKALHLCVGIPE